jgi:hypothetical protein
MKAGKYRLQVERQPATGVIYVQLFCLEPKEYQVWNQLPSDRVAPNSIRGAMRVLDNLRGSTTPEKQIELVIKTALEKVGPKKKEKDGSSDI